MRQPAIRKLFAWLNRLLGRSPGRAAKPCPPPAPSPAPAAEEPAALKWAERFKRRQGYEDAPREHLRSLPAEERQKRKEQRRNGKGKDRGGRER
jgi:hypothetical protein